MSNNSNSSRAGKPAATPTPVRKPAPRPDPLAFSPLAGLVEPAKRPALPKLRPGDVQMLHPLRGLAGKGASKGASKK